MREGRDMARESSRKGFPVVEYRFDGIMDTVDSLVAFMADTHKGKLGILVKTTFYLLTCAQTVEIFGRITS